MNRATPVLSGLALLLAVATVVRSAEPERPRPAKVGFGLPLDVLKLEERSITVKLVPTDKGGPAEQTLAIDPANIRVRVGEVTDREETKDGKVRTSVKFRPGTFADIKVGQRVQVMAVGDLATEIMIVPPMPPPPGRGDKKK